MRLTPHGFRLRGAHARFEDLLLRHGVAVLEFGKSRRGIFGEIDVRLCGVDGTLGFPHTRAQEPRVELHDGVSLAHPGALGHVEF